MDFESKKDELRKSFEAKLDECVERALRSKVHGIIPYHYFSAASSECRDMFIAGHFYGCVSLAQAVAEGLARFVARRNHMRIAKDGKTLVTRLRNERKLSSESAEAFLRIWGSDRDNYHHLNEGVEIDRRALEARAEECVNLLYVIESELFAYETLDGGRLRPVNPQYWPQDQGKLDVFFRLGE